MDIVERTFSHGSLKCPAEWWDSSTIVFIEPATKPDRVGPALVKTTTFRANICVSVRRPRDDKSLDIIAADFRRQLLEGNPGSHVEDESDFVFDNQMIGKAIQIRRETQGIHLVQHFVNLKVGKTVVVITTTAERAKWKAKGEHLLACVRSFVPDPSVDLR
ncbi:hypothetical protein ACFL6C_08305 [Myxococcota bacterium]